MEPNWKRPGTEPQLFQGEQPLYSRLSDDHACPVHRAHCSFAVPVHPSESPSAPIPVVVPASRTRWPVRVPGTPADQETYRSLFLIATAGPRQSPQAADGPRQYPALQQHTRRNCDLVALMQRSRPSGPCPAHTLHTRLRVPADGCSLSLALAHFICAKEQRDAQADECAPHFVPATSGLQCTDTIDTLRSLFALIGLHAPSQIDLTAKVTSSPRHQVCHGRPLEDSLWSATFTNPGNTATARKQLACVDQSECEARNARICGI